MQARNCTLFKRIALLVVFALVSFNTYASLPTFSNSDAPCHITHYRCHPRHIHHHKHWKKCYHHRARHHCPEQFTICVPDNCGTCCRPYHCVKDFSYHHGRNSAEVDICTRD